MSAARALLLAALLLGAGAAPSLAGGFAYCQGEEKPLPMGQAALLWATLDVGTLGVLTECAHEAPDGSGLQQRTSRGLLYWRRAGGVAVFTDGYRHWAVRDGALVQWFGAQAVDPPPTVVVLRRVELLGARPLTTDFYARGTGDLQTDDFPVAMRIRLCWLLASEQPGLEEPWASFWVVPQGGTLPAAVLSGKRESGCSFLTLPAGRYYVAVYASPATRWELVAWDAPADGW
jgi:hypothetical protein